MKREVLVNGSPAELTVDGTQFTYQSLSGPFHITPTEPGSYLVHIGPRTYHVTPGSPGEVSVNGRTLRIEVFDPRDLRPGAHSRAQQGRQEITASMPGKVIRVLVCPGDAVEAGQGLVVVEAMKMQNEMKSPQAGHVLEVRTQADATVAAGDILIVVE